MKVKILWLGASVMPANAQRGDIMDLGDDVTEIPPSLVGKVEAAPPGAEAAHFVGNAKAPQPVAETVPAEAMQPAAEPKPTKKAA